MIDSSKNSGGTLVIRPGKIEVRSGTSTSLFLTSDWHLGASSCRLDLLLNDLDNARNNNCRILINGDVFDAIVVGDKRHDPSEVHPSLRGTKDMINAVLEQTAEMLEPYAANIDMIGIGNHEDTIIRKGGFNMGLELVRRLNKEGANIQYGGYTGFVDYRFQPNAGIKKRVPSRRFVIHYHHGTSKGSKASTALNLLEMKRWADSDLYWTGHSHQKVHSTQMNVRVPMQGHELIEKEQNFVSTPGYLKMVSGQVGSDGTRSTKRNYAADAGFIPGGVGGAWVDIYHGLTKDTVQVTL